MLETLLTVLYGSLSVSPYLLSPIIPIAVGAVITKRGTRENNSVVWAIGMVTLALGATVELGAFLGIALLVIAAI